MHKLKSQFTKGITVCGNGPAVVLLHSSLSSAKQWQNLVNALKSDFTVINIDLLGYGDAEQVSDNRNYSFTVEVLRILAAVKSVTRAQKFHLVGHSCGGAIALKIATERPNSVLSLSLFEPVAFHLFSAGSEELKQIMQFYEQVHQLSNKHATQAFVDYWNGQGYFQQLPVKMQQQMTLGIKKVVLDFKGIFAESYGVELVSQIKLPCLFLSGKYSPELSQKLSNKIISYLPTVEYHQIASGHMAPLSHPQLVEPLIIDFLFATLETQ